MTPSALLFNPSWSLPQIGLMKGKLFGIVHETSRQSNAGLLSSIESGPRGSEQTWATRR
jgi:hypothetical protein